MGVPKLVAVTNGAQSAVSDDFDSVIIVSSNSIDGLKEYPFFAKLSAAKSSDNSFDKDISFLHVDPKTEATHGRLIFSPTGPVNRFFDDVRAFADAARKAVVRAKAAGSISPLLILSGIPSTQEFSHALEVSLLDILAALYEPIQAREFKGEDVLEPVQKVGFVVTSAEDGERIAKYVTAVEQGRRLAKDLGSGDPERMTAERCAQYIEKAFSGSSSVKVTIKKSRDQLEKEYPLLAAVARCSWQVERHHPRVVRLEYNQHQSDAKNNVTLLFSGKGITYDTGGADIKAGGHMSGMHLDKGGASAIAGFFKVLDQLQVKTIKAVAELAFVRNSSGADNYVSDEIIVSHAGVRVFVGNTDAEGRMVLADCLSHVREDALKEKAEDEIQMFTCATLTGHAGRTVGNYPIAVENGLANRLYHVGNKLQTAGGIWGDPFEISTLRREDFNFVRGPNSSCDVLQCNTQPSSVTARGHQFPAAFLINASGLDKHGIENERPLSFTHLDIAGAAAERGDYIFGKPTATPIVALSAVFVLPRL